MKNVLKVSTILSWVNMIVWGAFAAMGLLLAMLGGNMALLIVTVLTGVIVLHSYAALQLHKSIRDLHVPLSSQTPVGIRFIGFIALFFGVSFFTEGLAMLQNTQEIAKFMESQPLPQVKGIDLNKVVRATGVFTIVTGTCIAVNVFLCFRLLRWYSFIRE